MKARTLHFGASFCLSGVYMSQEIFVVFSDPYGTADVYSVHSTEEDAQAMSSALGSPERKSSYRVKALGLDAVMPAQAPTKGMKAFKVELVDNGNGTGAIVTDVSDWEEFRQRASRRAVDRGRGPHGDHTAVYVWAMDYVEATRLADEMLKGATEPTPTPSPTPIKPPKGGGRP